MKKHYANNTLNFTTPTQSTKFCDNAALVKGFLRDAATLALNIREEEETEDYSEPCGMGMNGAQYRDGQTTTHFTSITGFMVETSGVTITHRFKEPIVLGWVEKEHGEETDSGNNGEDCAAQIKAALGHVNLSALGLNDFTGEV